MSSVDQFGTIALIFAVLAAGLAVARGALGTPLLLLSARDEQEVLHETRFATGASLVLGVVIGFPVLLAGLVQDMSYICLPLAIALPIVLAQDTNRFASIATGRPQVAFAWDGAWAVLTAGLLVATWLAPSWTSPSTVLVLWVTIAGVSLSGLLLANRVLPEFKAAKQWWSQKRRDRTRFGIEAAIGSMSGLVVAFFAVGLIGTEAAAAIRGAGTVMGPLSVVMTSLPIALIPQALRGQYPPKRTWKVLSRLAAIMSAVALLAGLLGIIVPQRIGEQLFGVSWGVIAPLLPFTGIEYAAVVWVSCIFTALRAQGKSSALLTARIALSASLALSSVGACLIWGTARSMAIGLAFAALVVAAVLLAISTLSPQRGLARIGRKVQIRIVE